MHFEFLVEEQSAEAALNNILPRILGDNHQFYIHPYNGKADLIDKLPSRLNGYRRWITEDMRIIVLIDLDTRDCETLKNELETFSSRSRLFTRSRPNSRGLFHVINRIAIDELESWFFGDFTALRTAFPRIPDLSRKESYRDPDVMTDTAERLEHLLQRHGYYPSGMPKIEVAQKVSTYMDPSRNKSKSFQVFRDGLMN